MDKMQIYEATRAVPPEAQKEFNNGSFSGTDINPMWRIKTLTEQFGPCGIGWYYEVLSERAETYGDTVMALVDLNLYIKVDGEWSKPIFGTGGNSLVKATRNGAKPSDEGYKMALTDALSVACKALGIGADIYFAKDKTKYTKAQQPEEEQPKPEPIEDAAFPTCEMCGRPVREMTYGAGKIMKPDEVAKYTREKYNACLCAACASKVKDSLDARKSA
jgi:hypothetical protein